MRAGVVPSSWLNLGFGWDAGFLLQVAEECRKQGIPQSDLDAVRRVAKSLRARRGLTALIDKAKEF